MTQHTTTSLHRSHQRTERSTSNVTSSSEPLNPNPHLTPTSLPPITFPHPGTADPRYVFFRAPLASTSKRSYSLVVMTKEFSAVVHHFRGRVSYRGRRAQPPYDTTEWWEIVDLLLAVRRSSIPVFCVSSFLSFLVVVVVLLISSVSGLTWIVLCITSETLTSRGLLSFSNQVSLSDSLVLSLSIASTCKVSSIGAFSGAYMVRVTGMDVHEITQRIPWETASDNSF
jgi:hypothetical protein